MDSNIRRLLHVMIIILVAALALSIYLRAVMLLPEDYDEDDYLAAGQRYTVAIRGGDIQTIVNYSFNFEHPTLTKLVYGLVILPLPETPFLHEWVSAEYLQLPLPEPHFTIARLSSTIIGSFEVLFLTILNQLAGFMLATSTWQTKYTSQIMLESLPALTSLLLVLSYIQARRQNGIKRGARNSCSIPPGRLVGCSV